MAMTCSAFGCTWLAKEALSREKVERFGSTASSTKQKAFEKVELQASMADIFMTFSQMNLQMIFDVADVQCTSATSKIMSTVPRMQRHEAYMPYVHLRGACSSLPMSLVWSDRLWWTLQFGDSLVVQLILQAKLFFFDRPGGRRKKIDSRYQTESIWTEANPDFAEKCTCLASQDASCSSKSKSKHWHA